MIVKAFEVRDSMTFIPVIAIKMSPESEYNGRDLFDELESERYLLRRSGFNIPFSHVILCRMDALGQKYAASYDPYGWGGLGNRTLHHAHLYINDNFDELKSGDVIDVEYILNETNKPKKSERFG